MCIAKEWLHCFHAKLKHTLHCTAWAPGSRTYMALCTNWANMALEQERPIWPQDGMANMANPSFLDGPNTRQLKCTDLNTLSLREMKICTHISLTFALPMYKQVSQLLSIPTNVGQKFWADFPSPFPPKPAPKLTIDRPSHSRGFQSLLFDPSSL